MKPIEWVGSSRDDLREFPEEVREVMGYALYLAQSGEKHRSAKPLQGFGNAGVLEIVDDFDGNTYRTVYTIQLKSLVYVPHSFQKRSTHGITTSHHDIDLIKQRFKRAKTHYGENYRK